MIFNSKHVNGIGFKFQNCGLFNGWFVHSFPLYLPQLPLRCDNRLVEAEISPCGKPRCMHMNHRPGARGSSVFALFDVFELI